MHSRALQFLHKMNYNIIKAKFYLIFPYYLSYNQYKSNNQIALSDEEMETKIKNYLDGLKNNKSKDLQRWVVQLESSIESRITINKLNSLIQQAKLNKFEIPEIIRDQIDKATKLGKELKKMLSQSKMPIEKLLSKRDQLNDQKIITNEMILFQDTINRCEQWIIKANNFEKEYFLGGINQSGVKTLKKIEQKIEYKYIQMLVQEYQNLPVQLISFQLNTKRLYDQTNALLEKLPQFVKNAKTRTSNPSKITYQNMKILLKEISDHPINHQEFQNFERQIRQSLELIERISMFLEDQRCQKSIKGMNAFLKLANDLPIQNNIAQRLNIQIQYYNIIDKIKKDIINPNKFQQTQELINQAYQKGYSSIQLHEFESKLKIFRGWFQSTQILNQMQIQIRLVDLIKNQSQILVNMIEQSVFRSQLQSARTQLNLDSQMLQQYTKRLNQIDEQKVYIRSLLISNQPDLKQLVHELLSCIRHSLKYPQFLELYARVKNYFSILAKIQFLLEHYQFNDNNSTMYFFKKQQYEEILSLVSSKKQMKDWSKSDGQKLMKDAEDKLFPKSIVEWKLYSKFMQNSINWHEEALKFINNYHMNFHVELNKLEQLMDQSQDILNDQKVINQLVEIQQLVKWKLNLQSKLQQKTLHIFNEQDARTFNTILEQISIYEYTTNNLKDSALKYLSKKKSTINNLIERISNCTIQKTHKLTDLNKLYKEVEKLNFKDKNLIQLKEKLYKQIQDCEIWKDRYTALRKVDKKILKKQQQNEKQEMDLQNQTDRIKKQLIKYQIINEIDNINQKNKRNAKLQLEEKEVEGSQQINPNYSIKQTKKKQKYTLKNPEFVYYFKLPLLLIQFYKGTKLKTTLQELIKLKNLLEEVYDFNNQLKQLNQKQKPTSIQINNLHNQGCKLNLFFLEGWKLKKKNTYIQYWIKMANNILQSVPILKMQQLQQRKITPIYNQNYADTNNVEALKSQSPIHQPTVAVTNNQIPKDENITNTLQRKQKRQRKVNTFYCNDQMALLTQQLYNQKTKKKRKMNPQIINQTPVSNRRKNESKKMNKNQQMMRQVQQYLEDPTQYCICRIGLLNQVSYMLQCQQCEVWFHTECVGIRKSYVKNVDKYYCVACSLRLGIKEDYMHNFFWENHKKIKHEQFKLLVEQGQQLKIQIQELNKLETIMQRITKWIEKTKKVVDLAWHTTFSDTKEDYNMLRTLEAQLFELYLESFWFPTIYLQTDIIVSLLKKHWYVK